MHFFFKVQLNLSINHKFLLWQGTVHTPEDTYSSTFGSETLILLIGSVGKSYLRNCDSVQATPFPFLDAMFVMVEQEGNFD